MWLLVDLSYSCYGSVTSLNGEVEQGVIVEAVGDKPECNQEESKTEADGSYRIRGLQVLPMTRAKSNWITDFEI